MRRHSCCCYSIGLFTRRKWRLERVANGEKSFFLHTLKVGNGHEEKSLWHKAFNLVG